MQRLFWRLFCGRRQLSVQRLRARLVELAGRVGVFPVRCRVLCQHAWFIGVRLVCARLLRSGDGAYIVRTLSRWRDWNVDRRFAVRVCARRLVCERVWIERSDIVPAGRL